MSFSPTGSGEKYFFQLQLDLVGDALGFIALAEERDRLGRRNVRLEVDVDKRPRAILCEQILVDEIDVRDVLDDLLEVGVVLDIYAAGHDDVGDIACPVNIRGIDRDLDFSPFFHFAYPFFKFAYYGTVRSDVTRFRVKSSSELLQSHLTRKG